MYAKKETTEVVSLNVLLVEDFLITSSSSHRTSDSKRLYEQTVCHCRWMLGLLRLEQMGLLPCRNGF